MAKHFDNQKPLADRQPEKLQTPTEQTDATPVLNPVDGLRTDVRVAEEAQYAAQVSYDNRKEAEKKATEAREEAETLLREAQARTATAKQKLETGQVSDDPEYVKALNEQDGLTLIHKDNVERNATVTKHSDKVYPGDMVIAKRK